MRIKRSLRPRWSLFGAFDFIARKLAFPSAILFLMPDAVGATKVWNGNGPPNGTWTNHLNWVGDAAPIAGDDLVFPASAAQLSNTNTFPAGTIFGTIQFDGDGYSLNGNNIVLSGGISVQGPAGSTNTIYLGIQLMGPVVVSVLDANTTLSVSGNINLGGNLLTVSGGGHLDLEGIISGSAGITKTGSGDVRLGGPGANTYTGPTTIDEGILIVNHGSALGTTASGTTLNGNATLRIAPNIRIGTEPLTLNSSGGTSVPSTALSADGGSNSWSGPITLSRDSIIAVNSAQFLNLSGAISGPGSLTKVGINSLIFSGGTGSANTYSGGTLVADGDLILAKTIVNSAVRGPLVVGDGAGNIASDLVRLVGVSQINNTCAVTVASSGVFDLNNVNEDIGSLAGFATASVNLGSGRLTLGLDNSSTTFSGSITGTGGLTKSGAGTFTVATETSYTGTTIVDTGTFTAWGTNSSSGFTVNAAGTLTGNGSIGPISVLGGTLAPGDIARAMACRGLSLNSASDFVVQLTPAVLGGAQSPLAIQGAATLGSSALRVSLSPTFAPEEGEPFILIQNDGTDAVAGTFAGLPNGSLLSISNLQLRIIYNRASGNDVILTLTNTPLRSLDAQVSGGNQNGIIDPNECNFLQLTLTNLAPVGVTVTKATLKPNTPGVSIVQPFSSYPILAPGTAAANVIPFEVTTATNLACGSLVRVSLVIETVSHGMFSIPFTLPTPANCVPGAGPCDLCANATVFSLVATNSPAQIGRLFRDGNASVCGIQKFCPNIILGTESFHFDAMKFRTGDANACVTVSITAPCAPPNAVFCSAYARSFNPANPCQNYLGDAGSSVATNDVKSFAFEVPPNEVFVVVVSEVFGNSQCGYELTVSGGDCQPIANDPMLDIAPAGPGAVVLSWPAASAGYQLEATNNLPLIPASAWPPVTGIPVIDGGRYRLTNSAIGSHRFYRLRKP